VWVRTLAADHGLRQEWIEALDLCAVELVANIVDYAYRGQAGEIRLSLDIAADHAHFAVEDCGPHFDPLLQAAPSRPASLEEANIGGYGIHLVRSFADQVSYRRVDGWNRLELSFGAPVPQPRTTDRRRQAAVAFPVWREGKIEVTAEQRSGLDRRALGFISRTELFRGVPYDQLERIVSGCRLVMHERGALVLEAGQHGRRVWVVIDGALRVHFSGPDSDDFVEIPQGQCVGEVSVADGKLSSAWVVAAEDSRLLEIDSEVFLEHLLSIPKIGRNLITILADRMRRSNQSILARVKLEMEYKALQRELDFARRIQANMLPDNPLLAGEPRLDCHGYMRPARQVGGDFFDAIRLDDDRILLAIGDVCNKGMPAALFMAQTLTLLRGLAMRTRENLEPRLADLVREGNDLLCLANSEQLFVSLFVAVADLAHDELLFVNAGHNPPLMKSADGGLRFVDQPRNPVAGLVAGLDFRQGCLHFAPGDVLVLYTDGITEAENSQGGQLGDAALFDMVAAPADSAAALVDRIVSGTDLFAAGHGQADDITLLVVSRPGRTAESG
jgi:serine phosphatase RsbU (regulator of sigma subunit)/anti-sigma regulatory factor (Ser/Thr protein kinase)